MLNIRAEANTGDESNTSSPDFLMAVRPIRSFLGGSPLVWSFPPVEQLLPRTGGVVGSPTLSLPVVAAFLGASRSFLLLLPRSRFVKQGTRLFRFLLVPYSSARIPT